MNMCIYIYIYMILIVCVICYTVCAIYLDHSFGSCQKLETISPGGLYHRIASICHAGDGGTSGVV